MPSQIPIPIGASDQPRLERIARAAAALYDLLEQADPTGTPGRHDEWPLQILAADDFGPLLAAALTELGRALGRCPEPPAGPAAAYPVGEE